jgi:hypothetical protein
VNNNFTETLTDIIRITNESWSELGKRFFLNKSQISMLKNGRIEPNKHLRRLFESELERLRGGKPAREVASESMPAARVECEARPLGHIPFRGRDWSMDVPVYAEESRNEAVMRAAARLLSVARVAADARIVSQADADALVPSPQPKAAPSH